MHRLALVAEGGVAGDHEEPAQLGQRRDQILDDAVGEILLLGIVAHVVERQHCDHRAVRGRRGAAQLRQRIGRRRHHRRKRGTFSRPIQRADEAQSLARNGADQLLVAPGVPDRLARRVDAAGQRGIRHRTATPDRCDHVILGDNAVATDDEIYEEVEHLRLDRNAFVAAPQLARIDIKHVAVEDKLQIKSPGSNYIS